MIYDIVESKQEFNITEGEFIGMRKVSVNANIKNKPKCIIYSCPICDNLESLSYDYRSPSIPYGVKHCPGCGINLKWGDRK